MQEKSKPIPLPERLKAHWAASGLKVRPGVSEEQLRNFEVEFGVCLPQDMKDYFRAVDGMDVGDMANDCFSFWPLYAVKSIPNVAEELGGLGGVLGCLDQPESYFLFADYCLWCWGWAIRLTNDPSSGSAVFWTVNTTEGLQSVASSFSEFLELYLTNQAKLL